jgi:hypothetical protein
MAIPEGSSASSKAAPNRRRKRESPRFPSQGDGEGFGPNRDPNGVRRRGFGLREGLRESGKAFGRRRDPKGDFDELRLREVPRKAGRFRPSVFRKGDRRGFGLDASLQERVRLRPDPIQGSGGGASVSPRRPDGDRRGAFRASLRDPPGSERGFAASLRDPGESEAGVRARLAIQSRPARDGLATQRRQSRLGQVGAGGDTGPHYRFRPKGCLGRDGRRRDELLLSGRDQAFQGLRNWCLAPIFPGGPPP